MPYKYDLWEEEPPPKNRDVMVISDPQIVVTGKCNGHSVTLHTQAETVTLVVSEPSYLSSELLIREKDTYHLKLKETTGDHAWVAHIKMKENPVKVQRYAEVEIESLTEKNIREARVAARGVLSDDQTPFTIKYGGRPDYTVESSRASGPVTLVFMWEEEA